jgi:hypothetical protein
MGSTAALAALASLFAWVSHFDPSAPDAMMVPEPAVVASDCVSIARSRGKPLWRVQCREIKVTPTEADLSAGISRIEMRGIRNGSVNYDGGRALGLRAEAATYDAGAGRLELHGPVTLRTARRERLHAPSCIWTRQTDSLEFRQGATVRSDDGEARAPVAVYSIPERRLDCPNGARFRSRDSDMDAAVLYWDLNAKRLDLPGPVSGRRGDWRFTARAASLNVSDNTLTANDGTLEARISTEDPDQ